MAERPEKFPAWAKEDQTDPVSGQVNRSEPPEARKDSGWNRQEIPPRQWLNWLTFKANEWIEWLTGRVDDHIAEGVADSPHGIGSVSAFAGDQNLRTTDSVTFGRTQAGDFDSDQTGSAYNKEADQNLQTTDTVQFGRVTDAATPGDGDFDSDKLPVWGPARFTLTNAFDPGQEVIVSRFGNMVFVTTDGVLTHSEGSIASSSNGDLPEWARPGAEAHNTFTTTDNRLSTINCTPEGRINFFYDSLEESTGVQASIHYHTGA